MTEHEQQKVRDLIGGMKREEQEIALEVLRKSLGIEYKKTKKMILVMDIPDSCEDCHMLDGKDDCFIMTDYEQFAIESFDDMKQNCPFRDIPHRFLQEGSPLDRDYEKGWNACIDEILKGAE